MVYTCQLLGEFYINDCGLHPPLCTKPMQDIMKLYHFFKYGCLSLHPPPYIQPPTALPPGYLRCFLLLVTTWSTLSLLGWIHYLTQTGLILPVSASELGLGAGGGVGGLEVFYIYDPLSNACRCSAWKWVLPPAMFLLNHLTGVSFSNSDGVL